MEQVALSVLGHSQAEPDVLFSEAVTSTSRGSLIPMLVSRQTLTVPLSSGTLTIGGTSVTVSTEENGMNSCLRICTYMYKNTKRAS